MAETTAIKQGTKQENHRARVKTPLNAPDELLPASPEIVASSLSPENLGPPLLMQQLQGPGNREQGARFVLEMQRRYGNRRVQRALASADQEKVSPDVAQRLQARLGSGHPLAPETRADMEPAFGQDLGEVRVHSDAQADSLATDLTADAFTVGQDVFFRSGQYSPTSNEGKKLLAHELTHVVQQGGPRGAISGIEDMQVSQPEDPSEMEAERVSSEVLLKARTTSRRLDSSISRRKVSQPTDQPLIQEERVNSEVPARSARRHVPQPSAEVRPAMLGVQRQTAPAPMATATTAATPAAAAARQTEAQARALVRSHVAPRDCFIWFVNNTVGWAPMGATTPGARGDTGCAHWVAHELNITTGLQCQEGFSVRTGLLGSPGVTTGMTSHQLAQAQVGDTWASLTLRSHVGIVRAVDADPATGVVRRAQVEHDSSRNERGVVTEWMTQGEFYRPAPASAPEAESTAASPPAPTPQRTAERRIQRWAAGAGGLQVFPPSYPKEKELGIEGGKESVSPRLALSHSEALSAPEFAHTAQRGGPGQTTAGGQGLLVSKPTDRPALEAKRIRSDGLAPAARRHQPGRSAEVRPAILGVQRQTTSAEAPTSEATESAPVSRWDSDPGNLLADPRLSPEFAAAARAALQAASDAGLRPQVHEAYRTAERSDELYKKWKAGKGGRAAPGWASVHNYGLAMDVYVYDDTGSIISNTTHKGWYKEYKKLNTHLKAKGFEWGEPINDANHWEYHPGWKGLADGKRLEDTRKWAMGLAQAVDEAKKASVADWLQYFWWAAGAGGEKPASVSTAGTTYGEWLAGNRQEFQRLRSLLSATFGQVVVPYFRLSAQDEWTKGEPGPNTLIENVAWSIPPDWDWVQGRAVMSKLAEVAGKERSSPRAIEAIVKRYDERIKVYREYYKNPKYRKQEKYFGTAIVNVIVEIKKRLGEFENPQWISCISDFLQNRWYIGVRGAPAFEAKYGREALLRFQNVESSETWREALRVAARAETDPDSFDTNAEQKAAIKGFPADIQDAFGALKLVGGIFTGDPVFDDDKEYATYLRTIAHDYIDLSDAMAECGCGSKQDWELLVDILTDESAGGAIAWFGDVLGFADEALENFITLTMKRAGKVSAQANKTKLVCPEID